MTKLIIRPAAEIDLFEIDNYSVREFGPRVAAAYLAEIEVALDRLIEYPEAGPVFPGISPMIRYISCGKHRIFYDYDGKTVHVARILHQAMLPGDHL